MPQVTIKGSCEARSRALYLISRVLAVDPAALDIEPHPTPPPTPLHASGQLAAPLRVPLGREPGGWDAPAGPSAGAPPGAGAGAGPGAEGGISLDRLSPPVAGQLLHLGMQIITLAFEAACNRLQRVAFLLRRAQRLAGLDMSSSQVCFQFASSFFLAHQLSVFGNKVRIATLQVYLLVSLCDRLLIVASRGQTPQHLLFTNMKLTGPNPTFPW